MHYYSSRFLIRDVLVCVATYPTILGSIHRNTKTLETRSLLVAVDQFSF